MLKSRIWSLAKRSSTRRLFINEISFLFEKENEAEKKEAWRSEQAHARAVQKEKEDSDRRLSKIVY